MSDPFEKIDSKHDDLTELLEQMDKNLNISKSHFKRLFESINQCTPSIDRISLENLKIHQNLDANCILSRDYISGSSDKRIQILDEFTDSDIAWKKALQNEKLLLIDDILYFLQKEVKLIVMPMVLRVVSIAIIHNGMHNIHPGQKATIYKLKKNLK